MECRAGEESCWLLERERGRERERVGEQYCVFLSHLSEPPENFLVHGYCCPGLIVLRALKCEP